MKKKQILIFMALCLSMMVQATAFAAAPDVPWDSALLTLTDDVKMLARAVVTIMIAVTGTMVLFDSGSANAVKCARIVLGVGLTLGIGDFIVAEDGIFKEIFKAMSGNVDKPTIPIMNLGGEDKGLNFVGQFVTYYEQMCIYGASMLVPTALKVLAALVIIDMTVTLMFKLEGDHIQYLLQQIIRVGFFIFLIQCWIGGAGAITNVANLIFTSFEKIGINATGMTKLQPENILVNGFDIVTMVVDGLANNLIEGSIVLVVVQILVALAAFFCVAITSLELIICRLEFWTISVIIVPLIPFGCYQHTRFLFERAIGAIFNLGIKMAIVTFICIITGPLLSGLVKNFAEAQGTVNNIVALLMILFGTFVIAMLARKAPDLASGLFNGQPSLGGASMTGMAMGAASKAMGAAQMAAGGVGAVVQASNMAGGATALNTIAKAGGKPTIRDRMTRNEGNKEAQKSGHEAQNNQNGGVSAGWRPTTSANQQNQDIGHKLDDLVKSFKTQFPPKSNTNTNDGLRDAKIKDK